MVTTPDARPPGVVANLTGDAKAALSRQSSDQAVLEAVFEHGPSTRPVIARATGLSKPTVSESIRRLCAAEILVEAGSRHDSGKPGRVPLVYAVNPSSGFTVGLDIGGINARAALGDIYGNVVCEVQEASKTGEQIADQVAGLLERVLTAGAVPLASVMSVAVSTPGVVEPSTQRLRLAYNLGVDDGFDLVMRLRGRVRVPIIVENNVNAAAVGEFWRGWGRTRSTFVFVSIGAGIGMSLIHNGVLIRGANGAAGEIGYLPLAAEPLDTRHHRRGALEDEVGNAALIERMHAEHNWAGPPPDSVAELFTLVDDDPAARRIVDEASTHVGFAIASIVAVIDPGLIVLGGGIGSNRGLCERAAGVAQRLLPFPPDVRVSELGASASLHGAVHLAIVAARDRLTEAAHSASLR